MMKNMGDFNNRNPDFASVLMYELYERHGRYEVEVGETAH